MRFFDNKSVHILAPNVRCLSTVDHRIWCPFVDPVHMDCGQAGYFGPKGLADEFKPISLLKYLCWLVVEIAKADWAVSKLIISHKPVIGQRLLLIPSTQQTDLGKMLFANSITITPGTVTVETEADNFIVHALTDEAADKEVLADMGDRVSNLEKDTVQA